MRFSVCCAAAWRLSGTQGDEVRDGDVEETVEVNEWEWKVNGWATWNRVLRSTPRDVGPGHSPRFPGQFTRDPHVHVRDELSAD